MQNQMMVLGSGMTITSPNKGLGRVKREFKKGVGLSPNCGDAETLQAIGDVYAMNGMGKKFNDLVKKREYLTTKYGIKLVSEKSIVEQERETAKLN